MSIRDLIEQEIRKVIQGDGDLQSESIGKDNPSMGSQYKIVILDRGWVFAGDVAFENEYVVITNCVCIRRWGTTQGLGQLAKSGPTEKTVLDESETLRVHRLSVVALMDSVRLTND